MIMYATEMKNNVTHSISKTNLNLYWNTIDKDIKASTGKVLFAHKYVKTPY